MDPLERLSLFQEKVQSEANRYTYEGITGAAEQIGALPERLADMQGKMVAIASQRMRAEQMGKQMQMQSQLLQLRAQKAQTDQFEAQARFTIDQMEAENKRSQQEIDREKNLGSMMGRYVGQWMPDGRGGHVMMQVEMTPAGPKMKLQKASDLPEDQRAEAEEKGKQFGARKQDPLAAKRMEQIQQRITTDQLETRRRIASQTIDNLGMRKRNAEEEAEYQAARSTMRSIDQMLGGSIMGGSLPPEEEAKEATKRAILDEIRSTREVLQNRDIRR